MDPFKITCVTCRARLAVRNESLIGQIIACPKCGSMVQVARPAADAATDSSSSNSSISGITLAIAAAPTTPAPTFDDFAAASAAIDAGAVAEPTPFIPMPPPKAATWSTMKLAVLAGLSAAIGSALVATVVALLRDAPDAPPPAAVAVVQPAKPIAASQAAAPTIPPAELADSPESIADEASPTATEPPQGWVDDNPFELPPAADANPTPTVAGDAASSSSPPPLPAPPGAKPEATATVEPAAPVAAPSGNDEPRLRIDPLDLDPEGLDLSTLLAGRVAADPLAASDLDATPAPVVDSAVPAKPADGAPPDEAPPAEHPRFEPVGPPTNVASLLARRVPALTIEAMPLCRFLDFAVEFSGLPVSVSPDELRLAAISAATPASVDAQDATIVDLLATALKPLRLAPQVAGSQIVLRRIVTERRRELSYPVDDLAATPADMTRLAGWVQDLVAPETWKPHGGGGTLTVDGSSLRIDHDERVGYETILFLERYRAARGLKPRSKYPAALLTPGDAGAALAARMQAPATFTFSQPTSLRSAIRWWQEETDTAILVDWPALTDQRCWPQSRITASATNRPWGEALAAALAPLGLGWRPVDGRTIEVTSLDKILTEPQLVLYRLSDITPADDSALLAQVSRLTDADSDADAGAAFYDAEHRVLLVRRPAAAQRRLDEWLAAEGLLAGARATDARATDGGATSE